MIYTYYLTSFNAVGFYLEGNISTNNAVFPGYIRLINTSDSNSIVAASKVGTIATSIGRVRSDALTLIHGNTYRVQVGVAKGAAITWVRTNYTP